MNLLDMDNETPSQSITDVVTLSAEAESKMKVFYNNACSTKGFSNAKPLMENEAISVSVAHEYRGHQGRMLLTVINRGRYDITDLEGEMSTFDGVVFKVLGPSQKVVSAGGESKFQIASECQRPFRGVPNFKLSFKIGASRHEYSILVPTSPLSFSSSLSFDQATFMARWNAITAENTQNQQIFVCARPINPDLLAMLKNSLMPALNIGHIEGIDNDKTFTGACSFTAASDGKPVAVGVLLRLEGDPAQNRFRITVRATNPVVSMAIKDSLVSILS